MLLRIARPLQSLSSGCLLQGELQFQGWCFFFISWLFATCTTILHMQAYEHCNSIMCGSSTQTGYTTVTCFISLSRPHFAKRVLFSFIRLCSSGYDVTQQLLGTPSSAGRLLLGARKLLERSFFVLGVPQMWDVQILTYGFWHQAFCSSICLILNPVFCRSNHTIWNEVYAGVILDAVYMIYDCHFEMVSILHTWSRANYIHNFFMVLKC